MINTAYLFTNIIVPCLNVCFYDMFSILDLFEAVSSCDRNTIGNALHHYKDNSTLLNI